MAISVLPRPRLSETIVEVIMEHEQLPNGIHEEISRLCAEGDNFVNSGDDQAAYDKYCQAWELVPENKADWEASTWILGAVGEIQFRRKKFDNALNSFLRAVQCPNGLGNPYIHLRIGQSQFELGNMTGAGDSLARAFMGAGEGIFQDEDPKYFDYLQTVLLQSESDGG